MQNLPAPATRPIRLSWELRSSAPLEAVWEALSDTDRFNAAAGLGFQFEERPREGQLTARIGRASRLGGLMTLEWEELPFQYKAPSFYRVVRRFSTGPASQLITLCRLRPLDGAVSIRYSVEAYPQSFLMRPLVALELYLFTRPALERTLKAVLGELAGRQEAWDPRPPRLEAGAAARLVEVARRVQPPEVGRGLAQLILDAPLPEQDRIQPLALARSWGVEQEEAVLGMLRAVREGLLTLHWELICPNCLGPKARPQQLGAVEPRVHCPSCNIYFDATFPDSVAVTFRTGPAWRDFSVSPQCIGSPARQRQVLAQELLSMGGEAAFELSLGEGLYRLRAWPHIDTAVIEVGGSGMEGGAAAGAGGRPPDPATESLEEVVVEARPQGFHPPRIFLRAGAATLKVVSALGKEARVTVERRWRPPEVLTAGRLLELKEAKDLLPEGALSPDHTTQTVRCALVALEAPDARGAEVQALIEGAAPRLLRWEGGRAVLTFPAMEPAARLVATLATRPGALCALGVGPVVEMEIAGETIPGGAAVDALLLALRRARPGLVAVPPRQVRDPELTAALEGASLLLIATSGAGERAEVAWLSPSGEEGARVD